LQFAILTAARSAEVRGVAWSEIDVEGVPKKRMKARREHSVLSGAVNIGPAIAA